MRFILNLVCTTRLCSLNLAASKTFISEINFALFFFQRTLPGTRNNTLGTVRWEIKLRSISEIHRRSAGVRHIKTFMKIGFFRGWTLAANSVCELYTPGGEEAIRHVVCLHGLRDEITNVGTSNPEQKIHLCATFEGNPSNSCWHISIWTD